MCECCVNRQLHAGPNSSDVTRIAVQQNGLARLVEAPIRPSGDEIYSTAMSPDENGVDFLDVARQTELRQRSSEPSKDSAVTQFPVASTCEHVNKATRCRLE